MTHPRGDVSITINGEDKTLRLTLGALADIEDKLGGGDLAALQARLKNPRVSDIILILHALLAGGGAALTLAIAKAFEVLGGEETPGKPQADFASGEG